MTACAADPPWTELPLDVTAAIMQRVGTKEILQSVQKVCATWREVCRNPVTWRVINIRNSDPLRARECNIICRCAVHRSQGQLIDLTMENFGDDDLIGHIAERSSNLRRLTIACAGGLYNILGTALTRAVTELPTLEELHLLIPFYIDIGDLGSIGISCPMLKSFTFNRRFSQGNKDTLAIAENMPNLCHLRLFCNGLDNDELQAILDGCPHLKSLDLRRCRGVDLGGYNLNLRVIVSKLVYPVFDNV
ncbi:hypothetical protein C2S53_000176 [Perilla frutescens var. hirtella]|uniref:F-box domain-containing protein n=1 Tax=Perilla frutescens var. hirtella TaxID=608512 RepID=A0AAD4PAJ0_PERFH|nr:hypothetical protein C2S53_000176 [Perilla frutescens var. hirtella]